MLLELTKTISNIQKKLLIKRGALFIMKKVLHISHSLEIGGGPEYIKNNFE